MDKSTSTHGMNSDRGLSRLGRLRWLLSNQSGNLFPLSGVDSSLERMRFVPDSDRIATALKGREIPNSPARVMSDLFWRCLPWDELAASLGRNVTALEVGCGSGRYSDVLQDGLGPSLNRYIGIDINSHSDWKQRNQNPKINFVAGNSGSISGFLPETNLIVTQSALEHFEEDVVFFRQIAAHLESRQQKMVQIHLMPSAACLWTFLWHGVRQYTPRTLSKITALFGSNTRKTLFALGASRCNRVHRRYITYPSLLSGRDLRQSRADAYRRELEAAIAADRQASAEGEAAFYALVLETGLDGKLPLGSKSSAVAAVPVAKAAMHAV